MRNPATRRVGALVLLALTGVAVRSAAQDAPIPPRDERTTRAFVGYFERAESWPIRALALMSWGSHWHPVGTPTVTAVLEDRDETLLPFAVETLRRTRSDVLRAIADADLIDALLDVTKSRHPLLRERSIEILRRIADDESLQDRRDLQSWWRRAKRDGWKPAAWPEIVRDDEPDDGKTTTGVLDRAFDLRESGLDAVVVIDATGSMQAVIDQAVRALDDVIVLLGEIAPELRLGVVVYRDFGDMKDGAECAIPLTRNTRAAQKELAGVRAYGGGDVPERVEKGLEIALDVRTGWRADANKLVLLVGDAPPHAETETAILDMVRAARERGQLSSARPSGPTTGAPAEGVRPFVVSTISANQQADRPFQAIADVGGGTFARLGSRGGRGPRGGRDGGGEAVTAATNPAEAIAGQVLVDSFGSQFRDATRAMLAVWFEYRAATQEARRGR